MNIQFVLEQTKVKKYRCESDIPLLLYLYLLCVSLLQDDPLSRQFLQPGRWHLRIVPGYVVVSKIICQDKQDVWFTGFSSLHPCQNQDTKDKYHLFIFSEIELQVQTKLIFTAFSSFHQTVKYLLCCGISHFSNNYIISRWPLIT